MPMYEFGCPKCGDEFEELVRNADAIKEVVCPSCGSGKVKKKLSTFAPRVKGAAPASASAACNTGGT